MAQDMSRLFESLKKTGPVVYSKKVYDTLSYKLLSLEQGLSLEVVDAAGKAVNPGYEFYSGLDRHILKEIHRIKEKEAFTIDWEAPDTVDGLLLTGHDYLLSLLVQSPDFVNEQGNRITLMKGDARVRITIEPDADNLESRVGVWHDRQWIRDIVPVSESYILSGSRIFHVQPLGPHFQTLSLFETRLTTDTLEQFLTLLFSNLSHVEVDCRGYAVKPGESRTTRPALIFEKVSRDHSLHMRVSASYPGYSPDFFDNFEINRLASINDLEKKIMVSPLVHGDIPGSFADIQKRLKKHARALKISNPIYVQDNFIIVEAALAERFITRELSGLLSDYTLLGTEKLKAYKVKYVAPRMALRLKHGIDFLEGQATVDLDGDAYSVNDLLKQYKKDTYVKLSDGSRAVINPDYMEKLMRIFKSDQAGIKVSFFDLPIVEEIIGEKIAQSAFKKSRDIFLGFNKLKRSRKKPPALNATLRPYQKQGFRWISYLHTHGLGGCLADDMGLGKTVQTIAMLASIYPGEAKPSLIIMPKTLLFNWQQEVKKFAPKITVGTYYGTGREMAAALDHHIVLTTYAMVRNDIKAFQEVSFHMVILDESQNIKNLNSKISKAVMLLQGEHRLALSGTPMENNLGELYSLFRFLNPSMFGSFSDFTKNYLTPIQKNDNKTAVRELRKKIYPFILRRLKADVLTELPGRMEQVLHVDMSPEQTTLYHQRRLMFRRAVNEQIKEKGLQKSRFFILQALGELRQIASIPEAKSDNRIISPKREMLMNHVTDAVAGGHKVLVFANYLHSLECISQDLEDADIDHLVMTGSTRDRGKVVETFQNDAGCMALLMTLKTGGLGLNLTAAEYVFLFDPWWNVAAENQAIDRAHRMGQKNTVFSYRLIARDSIEEKILMLQEKKKELFDSLISSDNASIKQMDEDDIDFVLGGM